LLTRWTAAVLEKEIRPSAHTWSAMGGSYLTGQSVIGVAAAGRTILAATFEGWAPTTTIASTGRSYGLYLSTNGGQNFMRVKPGQGLPAGRRTNSQTAISPLNQFAIMTT
jgi:hypothetical protein